MAMELIDEAYFAKKGWSRESAERRNARRPFDLGDAVYSSLVDEAEAAINSGIREAQEIVRRRLP